MGKYRVEFVNKELRSVAPTEEEIPAHDSFAEEQTGETLWAIIEAADDNEAKEKAERLQTELRTRQTRRDLEP